MVLLPGIAMIAASKFVHGEAGTVLDDQERETFEGGNAHARVLTYGT